MTQEEIEKRLYSIPQYRKYREAKLRTLMENEPDPIRKYYILREIYLKCRNPIDKSPQSVTIRYQDTSTDGGPGSGNHGHKGVPGQVGGSAPTASARGENTSCVGFEHKRTLAWKRKKHGGMYSSMTDSEYETRAINFLKQECGGSIDGYLDKDGAICRFDTETGEFAKGFPGSYVKTYFNPGYKEKNHTFSLERAQRYFDKHKSEESTSDEEAGD